MSVHHEIGIIYKDMFQTRPHLECVTIKMFSYFSTKTYVVGTQKNRLVEMVLLSTQNIGKEIFTILHFFYSFFFIYTCGWFKHILFDQSLLHNRYNIIEVESKAYFGHFLPVVEAEILLTLAMT